LDITRSARDWKTRYTPITEWDRMFSEGEWDYLDSSGEAARYALIAGYIHRLSDQIHVLDVGCGAGVLMRYLDQSRVRYRGIDLSPSAVAQARERFPQADLKVADIGDYEPTTRERFDALVFNEVLPHVDDPLGSLTRYLEFLRPDGIAVISTYQNTNPRSNAAMFSDLLNEALSAGVFKRQGGCEVLTFERGLKWRIDVVGAASDDRY
jgi:2-polyprenyl-6-hydroxyphenyl methylase/3-demethylubiquinone-9 3-methyltransferase